MKYVASDMTESKILTKVLITPQHRTDFVAEVKITARPNALYALRSKLALNKIDLNANHSDNTHIR